MYSKKSKIEVRPFSVYCVCGGFGFPIGTASTTRVRLIGRALASCGIPFHVWHIGPSSIKDNNKRRGFYDGLFFEYLSPGVYRPRIAILRALYYVWGMLLLLVRLLQHRLNSVIYVYYQGDLIDLWTLFWCKVLNIPAVQEVCEWWPGTRESNFVADWMYRKIMFSWSTGAMPISQEIEDRIRSLADAHYPMCRVPVLIDPVEKETYLKELVDQDPLHTIFLWCGMVDGYKRDVLFLIDAMALLKVPTGKNVLLRIIGPCSETTRAELLAYASEKEISTDCIDILGFVSDADLWKYCSSADAFLMPLWDDDRSRTRFPTKFGQYLAAGHPIITVKTGEVGHFLTEDTALFYEAGKTIELANQMELLIANPAVGEAIASQASLKVLSKLDYRSNASGICAWFKQIYSRV